MPSRLVVELAGIQGELALAAPHLHLVGGPGAAVYVTGSDALRRGYVKLTEEAARSAHSTFSVLRERILEHLFVGELLRLLWRRQVWDVEVLRSEFDAYGYDLVLTRGSSVRHVQLKTRRLGGSTRDAKVAMTLQEKPSGCVVCVVVDDELAIRHFLWFGGLPGEPLPSLAGFRKAKHTKANAEGVKAERLQHRVVPFTNFVRVDTLDLLLGHLFGEVGP